MENNFYLSFKDLYLFNLQDKWNASIAFIVGGQVEDFENISILAQTVNSGVRRLFSVITAEDLYNQVWITSLILSYF